MGFRGQQFAFDSPAAAVAALVARARPTPPTRSVETIGLDRAAGRILAEDVRLDRDSPAFDCSAMDGYAVRVADITAEASRAARETSHEIALPVAGESRIGEPPPSSLLDNPRPGAVRIATGAPIPCGADAVIRREDAIEHAAAKSGKVASISVSLQAALRIQGGDHIRRRGENAPMGEIILRAGELISTAALATLATVGATQPRVHSRLRVAIITTGDELVEADQEPLAFQLRNSNGPVLRAVLASQAWAEVASVSHLRDDEDLHGVLVCACAHCDAVVLTGGISMGHRDPVRAAIERAGANIVFHGLPQRPGKPVLAAVHARTGRSGLNTVPIFGLPGNPVSSLITCTRIVLPALAACAGAGRTPPAYLPRLIEVRNPDGRTLDLWWHRLVREVPNAEGVPQAELIDNRGSGDVVGAGMSDGFVEVAPGSSSAVLPYYRWPA